MLEAVIYGRRIKHKTFFQRLALMVLVNQIFSSEACLYDWFAHHLKELCDNDIKLQEL
jgi:hypothetical protein